MLDNRVITALFVCISIWLVGFINKIVVEKKYNQWLFITSFYLIQSITYIFAFIYIWNYTISYRIIFLWFIWGVLEYLTMKSRLISLKWISSSLFFITTRLFSSLSLFIIWLVIFWDNISKGEYVWFFIWFIVFWLLFEKEEIKNTDYKRGLVFLLVSTILLIIIHSGVKYTALIVDNIFSLFISYSVTSFIIALYLNRNKIDFKDKDFSKIIYLNIIHAILFLIYIYFLFTTYQSANLGIAYKIQSYSIFIPIILSITFYKEKVTYRKIIAFILTIISLALFM